MLKYKVRLLSKLLDLSGWVEFRLGDFTAFLVRKTHGEDLSVEEWVQALHTWDDRIRPVLNFQEWLDHQIGKAYQKARRERLVRGAQRRA